MSYYEVKKRQLQNIGIDGNEATLNNSKLTIINGFRNTPAYKLGKLIDKNLVETDLDTRIVNIDKTNTGKKIYVLPDIKIEEGSYIKYTDKTYLIKEFEDNLLSPMCNALLCNQLLNWKGLKITPISCYITNSSYGSKGEIHNIEQMSDFDARAVILVGINEYTKQIRNGMRFIFNNSKDDVYEVTKKTTAYNSNGTNGYMSLTCKYVKWVQEDDFENNIAFNSFLEDNVNPSVDITIVGEEYVLINNSSTYTTTNATNITFSLDEDTLLEGNAEIVSQDGISCIVKVLKTKMIQLEARDNLGKLIANPKTIYGVTKL